MSETVEANVESPASTAPSITDIINEHCRDLKSDIIDEIYSQKNKLERQGYRASRRAEQAFQKAIGFGRAADKMSRDLDARTTLAFPELIESVSMENKKFPKELGTIRCLVVKTKEIKLPYAVSSMSTLITIPLGKYEIWLGIDRKRGVLTPIVQNITAPNRPTGYQHPHISNIAHICWGDGQSKANRYFGECNVQAALDMILYTLTHYNAGNPYIQLLQGWSFNMPRNERICFHCLMPIVDDNIYKIKTLCQCGRCVHCKQLPSDGHDADCASIAVPPTPPSSSRRFDAWVDEATRVFSSLAQGDREEQLDRTPMQPQYADVSVPATPPPMPVIPETEFVRMTQQDDRLRGLRVYNLRDSQMLLTSQYWLPMLEMMGAYVNGSGSVIMGTSPTTPFTFEYNGSRYEFSGLDNEEGPLVLVRYSCINESGNLTSTTAVIQRSDLVRWAQQREQQREGVIVNGDRSEA